MTLPMYRIPKDAPPEAARDALIADISRTKGDLTRLATAYRTSVQEMLHRIQGETLMSHLTACQARAQMGEPRPLPMTMSPAWLQSEESLMD